MQSDGCHTHSISVRLEGHINPCGEVVVDPGSPCVLSEVRLSGEPIGFMVDEWTALDDILYALKEDDLAETHGREEAQRMIAQEKASRSRKTMEALFNFFNSHTHNIYPPGVGFRQPTLYYK